LVSVAPSRAESASSATSTVGLLLLADLVDRGLVYEVGFKDGGGKQRWRTVTGGITVGVQRQQPGRASR
jgi:hypothetical protein